MLYGEQNTFRRTPGLVTWLFWVVLTAFGGIVGTFLLSFISEANASLNGLLIWFYLASPLFFVALGQWLLLRRFVAQSGWWLLTGILGLIFVYPYLLIYSSSALFTSGKSLIFGTLEFWIVSLSLAIMTFIFGSIVGLMQGILVIRRLGAVPNGLLWWVIGSAIAWGVGYPFGEQFLTSIFWHESTSFPQTAIWLVTGTTWGIIGAITGVVLIWIGRARVKVRCLRFLKHHFPVAIILIAVIVAGCCGKSGTTTTQTPTATSKGGETHARSSIYFWAASRNG